MTASTMLQPGRSPLLRDRTSNAAAHGSWPLMVALACLVTAAALLAAPITTTPAWVVPAAICTVVVLAVGQAVRGATGSVAIATIGEFATGLVAAIIAAAPDGPLAALTVVPTRIQEFAQQLPSDLPPMRDTPAVTFIAVVFTILIAIIADLIAFGMRLPAAALLPLIIFPAVPLIGGQPPAAWTVWLLAVALAVLYLYIAARWRRSCEDTARAQLGYTADGRGAGGLGGAVTTGMAAIGVAALVAALLPGPSGVLWNAIAPNTSLSTNRVNPIIDLGDDLRREKPTVVLRYATSQTEGRLPYLSLVSLPDFSSGTEWAPAEFDGKDALVTPTTNTDLVTVGPTNGGSLNLDHDGPNVNIILDAGVSAYLPHLGALDLVENVQGDYRRDPATGDLREQDAEPLAQSYFVTGLDRTPTPEELATLTDTGADEIPAAVALPEGADLDPIRAAMNEIVDPNAGPYAQALQLQKWFTGGAFAYSEQAPVAGNYDGTSVEVIERFLELRSGYCVHFASAMALMGRMLDIPTRIEVGFTPGTYDSLNDAGQPIYSVTTDDLHAWAEFWVPGYGWVPFETTPADALGSLTPPQLDTPETDGEAAPTTEPTPTPTPTPTPSPTDAPDESTPTPTPSESDAPAASPASVDLGPAVWIVLGVVAALVLVGLALASPRLVRESRRRGRRRRVDEADAGHRDAGPLAGASGSDLGAVEAAAAPPSREDARGRAAQDADAEAAGDANVMSGPEAGLHPAAAAWREVLDSATDYGMRLPRGPVGLVIAALAAKLGLDEDDPARAALERLAAARDRAAFAPPGRPGEAATWADVETVRAALAANATPEQARRARWRPASVLRGRRILPKRTR